MKRIVNCVALAMAISGLTHGQVKIDSIETDALSLGSVMKSSPSNPKLVVLVHGMTGAPTDGAMPGVPEATADTLDYNRFYFSSNFVQNLLGSNSIKTLSGINISGSRWDEHNKPNSDGKTVMLHGCRESVLDDHFIVPTSFDGTGTPPLALFSSYRDGSVHLMPQVKELINQLYDSYVAKFGTIQKPKTGFEAPDIIFVCHSMGGLAVRTLLCAPTVQIGGESLSPGERQKAQAIRERTLCVITLATPHEGSRIPDRVISIRNAIDNDSNWSALNFLSRDLTDQVQATARGLIAAPAIDHLKSSFWNDLNTGAVAPYKMERNDGSMVPVYTLAGHSPGGQFYTDPSSSSQFPLGGIDLARLGEENYRRDVVRSLGLCMLDYFLNTVPTTSGPKNWGSAFESSLDLTARYHRQNLGATLSDAGEVPSAVGFGIPTFYNRSARSRQGTLHATVSSDGLFDADGMVSAVSGHGWRLGTDTNKFFEHGREYSTPGGDEYGSWYRLPPVDDGDVMPWVYKNHDSIHRSGATGEWIRKNIVEQAGPLASTGVVSVWPAKLAGVVIINKALLSRLRQAASILKFTKVIGD